MDNEQVAAVFTEIADLLEIQGANPFRVRAYRNAARTVASLSSSLESLAAEGQGALEEIPGIGKDLAAKIDELARTKGLEFLDELRAEVPGGLMELTHIQGLGPKRVGQIWRELDVTTLDGLEAAAKDGRLDSLPGFGAKMQEKVLKGIAEVRARAGRFRIDEVDEEAGPLLDWLRGAKGVVSLETAGSFRRRRETVGDLDVLATVRKKTDVGERLASYAEVDEVLAHGPTKTSVKLASGLQVDLRAVPQESAGAALHYFTGSKAHNVALRAMAQSRGLKINEYGVYEGEERIAGRTERDVYGALGLGLVPPELREDLGEIRAAAEDALPRLVELEAIRGDLQMHTTYSDGRDTLEAMIEACRERGYEYMAVTDHSPSVRVANGLSPARFKKQYDEIEALQERFDDIRLLRSAEVDILADGSLDLDDGMLELMDVVLVSVHSKFNMTKEEMTKRIVKALRHPRVRILGHPTGRLINRREPYPLDVAEVVKVAREEGVLLELNAHPERLDLKDVHLRAAREAGALVVISTDAHRTADLALMRYGVDQARRAWLEDEHVANTRSLEEFLPLVGL